MDIDASTPPARTERASGCQELLMNRTFSLSIAVLASIAALSVAACSSGDVAVGSTSQALKKTAGGNPTGNGTTCSWDDAVSHDEASGATVTSAAPSGPFKLGDTFKSPDGCNDCSCTAQGIACTLRACAPAPGGGACTEEAKQCPDGSYVGRSGPSCEFAPCPEPVACTAEAKQCPDGSYVGRLGPSCEFAPCPAATACPQDAKQCPDGSYVGRSGPSCAFAPCP
jgi:hypothetical protein